VALGFGRSSTRLTRFQSGSNGSISAQSAFSFASELAMSTPSAPSRLKAIAQPLMYLPSSS
jgi:hypothetical protein